MKPDTAIGWAFIGVLIVLMGVIIGGAGMSIAQAKELRVGLQSFDDGTPGLDSYHTTNAQAQMLNSIHECLIEREPYSQPLKFQPALAESWKTGRADCDWR